MLHSVKQDQCSYFIMVKHTDVIHSTDYSSLCCDVGGKQTDSMATVCGAQHVQCTAQHAATRSMTSRQNSRLICVDTSLHRLHQLSASWVKGKNIRFCKSAIVYKLCLLMKFCLLLRTYQIGLFSCIVRSPSSITAHLLFIVFLSRQSMHDTSFLLVRLSAWVMSQSLFHWSMSTS